MRGIGRLIEGLRDGDPTARAVLIFALVGTAVIYLAVRIVRKRGQ